MTQRTKIAKRKGHAAKRERIASPEILFDIEMRELWVNQVLIKRLDIRATNQIAILAAFQELSWRRRIDDPLHPINGADPKARLRATIHCLNGHQRPHLVRFRTDGSGQGICWEFAVKDSDRRADADWRR